MQCDTAGLGGASCVAQSRGLVDRGTVQAAGCVYIPTNHSGLGISELLLLSLVAGNRFLPKFGPEDTVWSWHADKQYGMMHTRILVAVYVPAAGTYRGSMYQNPS